MCYWAQYLYWLSRFSMRCTQKLLKYFVNNLYVDFYLSAVNSKPQGCTSQMVELLNFKTFMSFILFFFKLKNTY